MYKGGKLEFIDEFKEIVDDKRESKVVCLFKMEMRYLYFVVCFLE